MRSLTTVVNIHKPAAARCCRTDAMSVLKRQHDTLRERPLRGDQSGVLYDAGSISISRLPDLDDGKLTLRMSSLKVAARPVVSGQKSNKINWLAVMGGAGWERSGCKAHETSVFSKTETDKICRHV